MSYYTLIMSRTPTGFCSPDALTTIWYYCRPKAEELLIANLLANAGTSTKTEILAALPFDMGPLIIKEGLAQ